MSDTDEDVAAVVRRVLPLRVALHAEAVEWWHTVHRLAGKAALGGTLGGIVRRARQRVIREHLAQLRPQLPDSTMWAAQHVARELYGRGLATAEVLAWATPGRTAAQRADLAAVRAAITDADRAAAARRMDLLALDFAHLGEATRTGRRRAALAEALGLDSPG